MESRKFIRKAKNIWPDAKTPFALGLRFRSYAPGMCADPYIIINDGLCAMGCAPATETKTGT